MDGPTLCDVEKNNIRFRWGFPEGREALAEGTKVAWMGSSQWASGSVSEWLSASVLQLKTKTSGLCPIWSKTKETLQCQLNENPQRAHQLYTNCTPKTMWTNNNQNQVLGYNNMQNTKFEDSDFCFFVLMKSPAQRRWLIFAHISIWPQRDSLLMEAMDPAREIIGKGLRVFKHDSSSY